MTLLLNFRTQNVAGSVAGPTLYDYETQGGAAQYRPVARYDWDNRARGRHVLLGSGLQCGNE